MCAGLRGVVRCVLAVDASLTPRPPLLCGFHMCRYYCDNVGLEAPTALCNAGYYCMGSAVSATPFPTDSTGGVCPEGSYCPEGSASPITCGAGTYTNATGASACLQCPARFYCDGSSPTNPQPCPAGNYCPEGTGAALPECPIGTFSDRILLSDASECQDCPPRRFCNQLGATTHSGDCAPGFYCAGGNVDATGATREDSCAVVASTPCTAGHYCLDAYSEPEPCPIGRYSPTEGNDELADCILCDAGSYCATPGLAAPTSNCSAG